MRQIFFEKSHTKSKHYQAGLQRKSRSQGKQTFLQPDQLNFTKKLVSLFLAADIPLQKLKHTTLKSMFATIENVIPSETSAWASVAQLASYKENQIRELL